MRRNDTTSAEYQRTFRGRHSMPGTGVSTYPRIVDGRAVPGTRYIACRCGWRLSEIKRSEMKKAAKLHGEHVAEVTK